MATTKTSAGPTPSGGVRSEALYADDDGNPSDESVATKVEITEYDEAGQVVGRTYGAITR
jgi:hypothetical protein